jgi:hypothetical protein
LANSVSFPPVAEAVAGKAARAAGHPAIAAIYDLRDDTMPGSLDLKPRSSEMIVQSGK